MHTTHIAGRPAIEFPVMLEFMSLSRASRHIWAKCLSMPRSGHSTGTWDKHLT